MDYRPDFDVIADYACQTGEGPLWHPVQKRLYWVDIPPGRLFRYDPATEQHEKVLDTGGEAIGGYTFQTDGSLLLFMDRGRIARWREGQPLETLIPQIDAEVDGRFNDVIADPQGRVFCGTMPIGDRGGKLYRLDRDGSLTVVIEDAGTSNGMGFSTDLTHFYHQDSRRALSRRWEYDPENGSIANPVPIIQEDRAVGGSPDGMTMDAANGIWSARWDGHALVHHMPDGRELQRIKFPVPKISSATFGGEDYTDIYVTTAGGHNKEEEHPLAGALLRINLGMAGKPPFFSRIGL